MSRATSEAARNIVAFEASKNVQSLVAAADSLQGIDLAVERDTAQRLALRKDALRTWLTLLAAIDRHLDPRFDPADVPEVKLIPPRSGDVALPAGASPDRIADPQARQAYEAAIKRNDAKAAYYDLQTKLRRLNDRATRESERFLEFSYSSAAPDQQEISAAIQQLVVNPSRVEQLRRAASGKSN